MESEIRKLRAVLARRESGRGRRFGTRRRLWTLGRSRAKLKKVGSGENSFAWYDPRRALGRAILALVAGVIAVVAIPARLGSELRFVAGWDIAALVMGTLAWSILARSSADETHRRAAGADPGRTAVWVLVLASSLIGLFATTIVMRRARGLPPNTRDIFVFLCLLAVISAWLLTHTAYALRYAHLYYRDDSEGAGLTFPGDAAPDYFDFAYFSFTIGMCFQVSDVSISSYQIRRATLSHALLSFIYNTIILAVALNLVVGIFG